MKCTTECISAEKIRDVQVAMFPQMLHKSLVVLFHQSKDKAKTPCSRFYFHIHFHQKYNNHWKWRQGDRGGGKGGWGRVGNTSKVPVSEMCHQGIVNTLHDYLAHIFQKPIRTEQLKVSLNNDVEILPNNAMSKKLLILETSN